MTAGNQGKKKEKNRKAWQFFEKGKKPRGEGKRQSRVSRGRDYLGGGGEKRDDQQMPVVLEREKKVLTKRGVSRGTAGRARKIRFAP